MIDRAARWLNDFLPGRPTTVHISPTNRCTLRCRQCDLWNLPTDGELDVPRWKQVVSDLRDDLGEFALKISGGEPFCVPDLLELVEHAKGLGLYVGLSSNGTRIDRETAQRIADAGVEEIHLSLDSLDPAIHDDLRGVKGTHRRVLQALDNLAAAGGKTQRCLATVVTRLNLEVLPELVRWATDREDLYTITLQALFQNFGAPYDPDWWRVSDLWPGDGEAVTRVFDELIEYKQTHWELANPAEQLVAMHDYFLDPTRTPVATCQAGKTDIAVDPRGNLRLCFNMPPVGNLLESRPRALLHSLAAAKRRRQIAACQRSCNLLNCNYGDRED